MNSTATTTLNGQELELFRIGNYGAKGNYSAADMEGVVARYAATGETPIAIGHVKSDKDPAYGWIKSIRFSGDKLYGTPGDVDPYLDKVHREKKYKNRSVAFAKDNEGHLYLHHLAVLGAVPPEVKGLQPAQFSNDEYIAFSEGEDMSQEQQQQQLDNSIMEGIKNFFSKFSAKPAEIDMDALTKAVKEQVAAEFSAQLDEERTARKKVETEFEAHRAEFSAGDRKSKVDRAIATLKSEGAWVPAYDKLGVAALFSALAGSEEVITFSDGQGVEQKPNTFDAAVAIFSAVGRIVPAGQKVAAATTATSVAAPESNGGVVDPDSATFSAMVTNHATEKGITYNEAYKALSAEGKRPASGSSSAGAV